VHEAEEVANDRMVNMAAESPHAEEQYDAQL